MVQNAYMPKDSHEKDEGTQYQLNSFQKGNVDQTNADMGYHNMADRANVAKKIGEMQGERQRMQEMGQPRDGSESTGRDY
jgi:hypothetical protein